MAKPAASMAVEEEIPEIAVEEEKRKKKNKKKEKIRVKVETFSEHPDKISHLVGYAPSGFDPLRHQDDDDGEESPLPPLPKVRVFRHEKRTNRLQLVVTPNGSQVNFVGTNYIHTTTTLHVIYLD